MSINTLGEICRLSSAETRSISPENPTGVAGQGGRATTGTGERCARDLGQGWKVSPSVEIQAGENVVLADIEGAGLMQHLWITNLRNVSSRDLILRVFWDDQATASIECPLGDFFGCGWEEYCAIQSLAVCVNPGRGFNCYWPMPFRKQARITLENRGVVTEVVYFQFTYSKQEIADDCGYFHAQFRRSNPLPYKADHTLIDVVSGQGQYVGTYLAWGSNSSGWWGEGEVKFFIDDDEDFPTICGTGTEDYICGSHNFDIGTAERDKPSQYTPFTGPYAGMPQVLKPDGVYQSQQRFGMYRWHITDPIRFQERLRVTVQALGWFPEADRRYKPLQDDIATVSFWYQTLPTHPFPPLPDRDYLAVV